METACSNKHYPEGGAHRRQVWYHSDMEEQYSACSNKNEPNGGTHINMATQYCTDVYSDLEILPWQHKPFIFTQVFVILFRSHGKLLTFRQISCHIPHRVLYKYSPAQATEKASDTQADSSSLLKPRIPLETQTMGFHTNKSHLEKIPHLFLHKPAFILL